MAWEEFVMDIEIHSDKDIEDYYDGIGEKPEWRIRLSRLPPGTFDSPHTYHISYMGQ